MKKNLALAMKVDQIFMLVVPVYWHTSSDMLS
jgi:hypothetical protein